MIAEIITANIANTPTFSAAVFGKIASATFFERIIIMKLSIHKVTGIAVLIAINIILGKLSIGPSFASVNLGFIALIIAGYLYGVKLTMLAAVLANLLAFTVLGNGSFSFWFLLPALLAGASYGLLNKPTLLRIIIVNATVVVGISFLLNTGLIAYVYRLNYESLLATRIFKMFVGLVVQIAVSYIMLKHSAIISLKKQIYNINNI